MQHPAEAYFSQLHASLGVGKTTQGTRGEGFLDIHLNATTR